VGFFIFLCSFVLLYAFPLIRQLQNNIWGTISSTGDKRRTPKLLRLKHHCIWTWRFVFYFFNFLFFILFYFICIYIYIYTFHLLIFYFYS
jgi:hypothetical protein